MELLLANRSIYNLLEIADAKKEDIRVRHNHRKLGKSTALIQYAKDNGYYLIVGSNNIAKMHIKNSGYKKIKSINSDLSGIGLCVFDECCPKGKLKELRSISNIFVTGFVKEDDFYPEFN